MPETKPNQYLKNLDVQFISLVDAGANRKELVYKAAASREAGSAGAGSATSFSKQVKIVKTDQDKRLVYCIVYSPDETDAHGDAMKAEEIEKAAHHFLFEGRTGQVDKQHNEQADQGRVVESYITRKNDANFPDDPQGSWAVVIKVLDDDTWEEVKKGTITGVSMQGWCTAEPVEQESTKGMFQKIMNAIKGNHQSPNPFSKGEISKDFTERMMHRQIRQAIWTFEEEATQQLNDDDIDDKKAAVLSTIDEFRGYISDLSAETTKQFKKDIMSEEKKKEATSEKETEQNALIDKATEGFTKALDEAMEPIQQSMKEQGEKLEGIEERLKAVEEAAPGSQTRKGQEEDHKAEKGFKGVSVFGSGPQQ